MRRSECVFGLVWDESGQRLAWCDARGRVGVMADDGGDGFANNGGERRVWQAHRANTPVYALAALQTHPRTLLLSGGVDDVALWDLADSTVPHVRTQMQATASGGETNSVAVSSDGHHFLRACGTWGRGGDGHALLHDVADAGMRVVADCVPAAGCGTLLCCTRVAMMFAVGAEDGCVHVIDPRCATGSNATAMTLRAATEGTKTAARPVLAVDAATTGGGGTWLAIGGCDGTVGIWNLAAGASCGPVATVAAGSPVQAIRFVSDGTIVAGCLSGKVLKIRLTGAIAETIIPESQSSVFAIAERYQPTTPALLFPTVKTAIAGNGPCIELFSGSVCTSSLFLP